MSGQKKVIAIGDRDQKLQKVAYANFQRANFQT